MVSLVFEAKRDLLFLQEAFEALQLEHQYWTQPPKAVRVAGPDGAAMSLSRYYADTTQPRPESYRCATPINEYSASNQSLIDCANGRLVVLNLPYSVLVVLPFGPS